MGRESLLGSSFGLRIATVAPTVKKTTHVPLSVQIALRALRRVSIFFLGTNGPL